MKLIPIPQVYKGMFPMENGTRRIQFSYTMSHKKFKNIAEYG